MTLLYEKLIAYLFLHSNSYVAVFLSSNSLYGLWSEA